MLKVTQPRMPCFKLNLRFDLHTMVKLFWQSGFSGIYFGVVEEGDIAAGDSIQLLERPKEASPSPRLSKRTKPAKTR